MKIDYTYKEVEQPIKKAEWKSSYGTSCELTVLGKDITISTLCNHGWVVTVYSLQDFRDYVALMNRVLKQMETEAGEV